MTVSVVAAKSEKPAVLERYGSTPLRFEPNLGQASQPARFIARGANYGVYFTDRGATLDMREGHGKAVAMKISFVGEQESVRLSGERPLASRSNYFLGGEQNWRTGVGNFERVRYASVYPGVDAVFYGNQRQLEYDFDVAPGADPSQIALQLSGADKLSIEPDGNLKIDADGHTLSFLAPIAYQVSNGERKEVASHFVLKGRDEIHFAVGSYDHSQPLVIDPTLAYSTFLGGSSYESPYSIAVDGNGDAYVTGFTQSSDFPQSAGAYAVHPAGAFSYVFVTKMNPTGTSVVYSTYFGGSSGDQYGQAIAVDNAGNAYVGGFTGALDFPVSPGAVESHANSPYSAGFLTKLNASGNAILYSTYIGATTTAGASVQGVAVDGSGNAYITGQTGPGFPVTAGAFQTTPGGRGDAFVAKLNSTGTAYTYASYLGGGYPDQGNGITVDGHGNAYVTGYTHCNRFPSTANAYEKYCAPPEDTFVTKVNPSGSALVYGTFLHTPSGAGQAIALDVNENAYIVGYAASGMPTTPGAFQSANQGITNAYIAKLNSTGTALAYSTYLGGNGQDQGWGIKVDLQGRAYVDGLTIGSTNFPVTPDAYQAHLQQGGNPLSATANAFLTRLNPTGTALDYSTYFGSEYTQAYALALDNNNHAYITGLTFPNDVPVTPNAYDRVGKQQDAFVAKFSFGTSANCIPATTGAEICSPANGATVSSPVRITAGAQSGTYLTAMRIYVDNVAVAFVSISGAPAQFQTTKSVTLAAGKHHVVVVAYQHNGTALTAAENITVQ
jgi:hypothetical protein